MYTVCYACYRHALGVLAASEHATVLPRGRVCVRGGVSGRAFSRGALCGRCHACPLCESRVRSPLCVFPSSTAASLSVSCPVRTGPRAVRSERLTN